MAIAKGDLRQTRSVTARGQMDNTRIVPAVDLDKVSDAKVQSKTKLSSNVITRSQKDRSKSAPTNTSIKSKPMIHTPTITSSTATVPTAATAYIVVPPKSGFFPTFVGKSSNCQAVDSLIADLLRIFGPLTPRQLRALRRLFRADSEVDILTVQNILQCQPQDPIADRTPNSTAHMTGTHNPNGPPVSSNQAFYFHHTDPEFKKSFPKSPLLTNPSASASSSPTRRPNKPLTPSPSPSVHPDEALVGLEISTPKLYEWKLGTGVNDTHMDPSNLTSPSFDDESLSSQSTSFDRVSNHGTQDTQVEDDCPVFSQVTDAHNTDFKDDYESDASIGNKRKRTGDAEKQSKRGKST